MRFLSIDEGAERIRGRSVAVVGSAPSVLENEPGFIDSHDIVVRVNNYRTSENAGFRTDVFYSFFGSSIRKSREELIADGVTLCWCKCPNSKPIQSAWHEQRGKQLGIDFRYIYETRRDWWFCDTVVPDDARFMASFNMLDRHIPSTGFAAILDVLASGPRSVYVTGFDFFASGKHNVTDTWRPGDPADPIGHRPDLERAWVAKNARHPWLVLDATLERLLEYEAAVL